MCAEPFPWSWRRPATGLAMAWPNSVDATDDYIYVSDIVNIRLLRLAKKFQIEATITMAGK